MLFIVAVFEVELMFSRLAAGKWGGAHRNSQGPAAAVGKCLSATPDVAVEDVLHDEHHATLQRVAEQQDDG